MRQNAFPKGATHHERQAIIVLFLVAVSVLIIDIIFLFSVWGQPPTLNAMWFLTYSIAAIFLTLTAMFFIVYGVLVRHKHL